MLLLNQRDSNACPVGNALATAGVQAPEELVWWVLGPLTGSPPRCSGDTRAREVLGRKEGTPALGSQLAFSESLLSTTTDVWEENNLEKGTSDQLTFLQGLPKGALAGICSP